LATGRTSITPTIALRNSPKAKCTALSWLGGWLNGNGGDGSSARQPIETDADWDEDYEHLRQKLHGLVQNGTGGSEADSNTTLNGSIRMAIEQRQARQLEEQGYLAPTAVAFRWPMDWLRWP